MTEAPLVHYPNLKRVVNFIYDGQVTIHSEDELSDFMDALVLLKVIEQAIPALIGVPQVKVEHLVTTVENTGNGELRVVTYQSIVKPSACSCNYIF